MALVAYASSDDSELSDNDETPEIPTTSTEKKEGLPKISPSARPSVEINGVSESVADDAGSKTADLIEDDEYDIPIANSNVLSNSQLVMDVVISSGLKLPAPKSTGKMETAAEDSFGLVSEPVKKKEKPLSGPKLDEDDIKVPEGSASKGSGLESMVYDDELEEEVKPKTYGIDLPKPAGKKAKQKVKIAIPSLPDSDSDEEDGPKKKKAKSATKSGLFSLLPEPKNMSVKESGRQLLPHTLTRRPPAKPAPRPVPKPPTRPAPKPLLPGVPDAGSDEEEGEDDDQDNPPTSFFSIGMTTSINATPSVPAKLDSAAAGSSSSAAPSDVEKVEPALRGPWMGPHETSAALLDMFPASSKSSNNSSSKTVSVPSSSSSSMHVSDLSSSAQTVPSSASPYDTGGSVLRPPGTETDGDVGVNDAPLAFRSTNNPYSRPGYNYPTVTSSQQMYPVTEDYVQSQEQEEDASQVDQYLQDEEFLKIQGKHSRGREAINIIDVSADAYLDPSNLVKNLTEETMVSHSRKRKDLPSSQQKRKHQITYLAHQAKERELELKNTWANNRQSKRQTQSKYGF